MLPHPFSVCLAVFRMSTALCVIGSSLSLALLFAGGSSTAAQVPQQSFRQWQSYGGDPTGAKYSALTQINRTNVQRLKPAWIYRCDDMRQQPASTIECNPIIVDGRMYVTSPGLKVLALDAATGQAAWTFDPWQGKGGRGVNRGVTYWSDGGSGRIFFVAGTSLYALDTRDGRPIQSFGTEGKVDLREGIDRDVFFLYVTATSPGIIYKDLKQPRAKARGTWMKGMTVMSVFSHSYAARCSGGL
jgi:quinoprotein glucose dehydrogenase